MFKQMKIGTKIGLGFGLLIAIAMILGGLAVVNMKKVAVESTKLSLEYVPEVDVASEIRGASNRVMYAMRGYGFTENEVFYEEALKEIDVMEKGIEKGRILSETAQNLKKLSVQLDAIETSKQAYKEAMKDTHDTIARLEIQRKALDKNAALYIETSSEFLEGQNRAFERDLTERQQKIAFVSDLVDLGSTVRVMNFKAQSLNDDKMLQRAIDRLNDVPKYTDQLRKITRDSTDIQRINDIVASSSGYQNAMREFLSEFRKGTDASKSVLDTARQKMDSNAGSYVSNCSEFLSDQQKKLTKDMTERIGKITLSNDIIDLGNDTRIKAFKSQALRDPSLMVTAQQNFSEIDKKFVDLRKITRLNADLRRIDTVQGAANGYGQAMSLFLEEWKQLQQLGDKRNEFGKSMIKACVVMADAGMGNTIQISHNAMASLNTSSTVMIIGLIVALIMGCLLAFFITRGITQSITRVADGLNEGAEQVASASNEVSGASQSLAEGSSEQAASVEEISSSLEEMSSMTRQNADNANQADSLMKEANQVVASANSSMGALTQSMEQISKASEETFKIIKTIDEIAFQTNLLALNAAVEAARAGEAGAGFAVVADEVRNLAMRAADAAKNTATLIEGTVKKVNEGGGLVAKTNEAFAEVAKSSAKVGDLVGEIAAASSEQAQGITQVNTAINEVDKVTQQNAASAEESASASEEMNAQAEQMRSYVGDLIALVTGSNSHGGIKGSRDSLHQMKRGYASASTPERQSHGGSAVRVEQKPQALNPEKVIPLDGQDFEDF